MLVREEERTDGRGGDPQTGENTWQVEQEDNTRPRPLLSERSAVTSDVGRGLAMSTEVAAKNKKQKTNGPSNKKNDALVKKFLFFRSHTEINKIKSEIKTKKLGYVTYE